MKAMICELCGGNDIIKQDGVYVCQHCGTKYSVEEAKKLLIEGTVKIDVSDELKKLYEIARRAKSNKDNKNAQKYYEQILVKNPSDWEAIFYTVYYQAMNCPGAEAYDAAIRLTNYEDNVLAAVRNHTDDPAETREILNELAGRLIEASRRLFSIAENAYNRAIQTETSSPEREQAYVDLGAAARDILYHFGMLTLRMFGNDYGKDSAVRCWKEGIERHKALLPALEDQQVNKEIIDSYREKIRAFDPDYDPPKKKGCYIATAVYGSYDCPPVWTLRRFRDRRLAATWYGRAFIRAYYAVSPALVRRFGACRWFQKLCRPALDRLVARLQREGLADTPYYDRNW